MNTQISYTLKTPAVRGLQPRQTQIMSLAGTVTHREGQKQLQHHTVLTGWNEGLYQKASELG